MRYPLLAWLFLQASTLCAAFEDLPNLLQRRVEIYDDPRAFRLEAEATLIHVNPGQDPEFWTALHTLAAEAAWFQEQSDIAQNHVNAALPRARDLGFLKYEALLTYVQGGILEYDAKAEEAELHFLKSLELARKTADDALIAHTSNATGSFFHRIGKQEKAAAQFTVVFHLLSKLPQDAHYYDMLSCIGALYAQLIGPRRAEGIRMLEESLEYSRAHHLRYESYWISQVFFSIYRDNNESDKVEAILNENLKLAQSLDYENYIASTYMERGRLHLDQKRYDAAEKDLEFARDYYRKVNVSFYDILILSDLGKAYVLQKKFDKIPPLLKDFDGALKETSSKVQKEQVYYMLQGYYKATGQKDKELEILRELLDLNFENSLKRRNDEIGRLTRDMEVQRQQFLNEKLTTENQIQNAEIQKRERLQKLTYGLLMMGGLALSASGIALRRGRQIRQQRANLKLILDTIEEGILRFGPDFIIQGESSHYAGELLGHSGSLEGQSIWDLLLARVDGSAADQPVWRESLRAMFGEKELAWELNEGNLPRELRFRSRILALEWQVLPDADGLTQTMLLLFRDITRQVAAQKEAAVAQERISRMADRIDAIARGRPQRIAQFLVEAEKTILPLQKTISMEENYSDIKRMLHTLKGAARTLGLKDITGIVHGFEDLFNAHELDHASFASHMQDLLDSLNAYRDLLPHLNMVQDQSVANLWDITSKLIPEARQRLAARYQKPARFTVLDGFAGWDRVDTRAVHDMLLHAMTNSIDHGFLLPHARGERLQEAPAVTLEALQEEGQLLMTLRDNGFGINWKKLEDLAREKNFQPAPGRELTDLLFQEGTSTAGQISTTSGRGMGLAAVLAIAKKVGGDVSLRDNDQGRGACLCMTLPVPAVAVPAA
ncbi:MAG TPA: ATP-binding protein [Oligoflexus sp.]|uniref:ATP-binding protein n=1 Tax=Oligoflexus sp. TaxID=1971216 RepID=UPI002D7E70D0|nr:ATP-binding protein [Oligoflexus sp.]HET9240931.1 ATP-binding protein [Oligoflexus sp.]